MKRLNKTIFCCPRPCQRIIDTIHLKWRKKGKKTDDQSNLANYIKKTKQFWSSKNADSVMDFLYQLEVFQQLPEYVITFFVQDYWSHKEQPEESANSILLSHDQQICRKHWSMFFFLLGRKPTPKTRNVTDK